VLAFLFSVCYVILYSICSVFGDAFEYLYFILYLCIVLLIFWRTNLKLSNHYLCYVNAGMWSVRVKQVVNAITLTPVWHNRHTQFPTSAPNFRWVSWPPWPRLPEPLICQQPCCRPTRVYTTDPYAWLLVAEIILSEDNFDRITERRQDLLVVHWAVEHQCHVDGIRSDADVASTFERHRVVIGCVQRTD